RSSTYGEASSQGRAGTAGTEKVDTSSVVPEILMRPGDRQTVYGSIGIHYDNHKKHKNNRTVHSVWPGSLLCFLWPHRSASPRTVRTPNTVAVSLPPVAWNFTVTFFLSLINSAGSLYSTSKKCPVALPGGLRSIDCSPSRWPSTTTSPDRLPRSSVL